MLKDFEKDCNMTHLSSICTSLVELSKQAFEVNNGNIPKWENAIADIQKIQPGQVSFKHPYVAINADANNAELTTSVKTAYALAQRSLSNWRFKP